jgi:pullulanase/glycogen debranching enzyme
MLERATEREYFVQEENRRFESHSSPVAARTKKNFLRSEDGSTSGDWIDYATFLTPHDTFTLHDAFHTMTLDRVESWPFEQA